VRKRLSVLCVFGIAALGAAEAAEPLPVLLVNGISTELPDDQASAVFQVSRSSGDLPVGTRLTAQYIADVAAQRVRFCIKTVRRPDGGSVTKAQAGRCLGYVAGLDGATGMPAASNGRVLRLEHATKAMIVLDGVGP